MSLSFVHLGTQRAIFPNFLNTSHLQYVNSSCRKSVFQWQYSRDFSLKFEWHRKLILFSKRHETQNIFKVLPSHQQSVWTSHTILKKRQYFMHWQRRNDAIKITVLLIKREIICYKVKGSLTLAMGKCLWFSVKIKVCQSSLSSPRSYPDLSTLWL